MASKLNIIIFASMLLLTFPVIPRAGYAQTGGGSMLKQPRNMAKGGAIAARRPGSWLSAAAGRHSEQMQKSVRAFGGADYSQTESDIKPSLGKNMMMAFLESLSNFVSQLGDLFVLLLESQQPQQPEIVE